MKQNDLCKQVFKYANQIGKSNGASALDSQHLIYGLVKCKESIAGNILAEHGITLNEVKKSFENKVNALEAVKVKGKLE